MSLSLIYARSTNWCIGKGGRIPWHLPDEFGHFKQITMGKPIIMGRKTYEDHNSLLPGRMNIVISSQPDLEVVDGIRLVQSVEQALQIGYQASDELFVIGGVAMFRDMFAQADSVYETIVHADIAGDAFLPEFDFTGWTTTQLAEHPSDERHQYAYSAYRHHRA